MEIGLPFGMGMRTVLVLEDNPGSRTAIRAVLEENGYEVLEAADERAAIRVGSRRRPIDLLVADVILRSNDGPQTARRLKALHPRMPILFMSGHPLDTLLNRGLLVSAEIECHGVAFVRKPFILRSFLEAVEKLLAPRQQTILVVDDEPHVRIIVRKFLTRRRYEVLEASSGAEALEVATGIRCPIRLLITDVTMPDMDGRELAARLTADRPETKVLFISGYTDGPDHHLDGDRSAFLAKPFTMTALLSKVDKMLDHK